MRLEIKLDDDYPEPKVVVFTASVTEEVQELLTRLSQEVPQVITGTREGKLEVLEEAELIRLYAGAGKVFGVTEKGEYTLRLRLYELEAQLDPRQFIRISNSEIINLKKVRSFDLSLTGTICVQLANGAVTYVSRRYVSKIKKLLGI